MFARKKMKPPRLEWGGDQDHHHPGKIEAKPTTQRSSLWTPQTHKRRFFLRKNPLQVAPRIGLVGIGIPDHFLTSKMGASNSSYLSNNNIAIFHFHDYGRKSTSLYFATLTAREYPKSYSLATGVSSRPWVMQGGPCRREATFLHQKLPQSFKSHVGKKEGFFPGSDYCIT